MKGMKDTGWILLILALLFFTGVISIGKQPQTISGTTTTIPVSQGSLGYPTVLRVTAVNAITGSIITDANAFVYSNDGSFSVTDVAITSPSAQISNNSPNVFSGYAMIGNDQGQGTDRGTEYYYRKIPFSYSMQGVYDIREPGKNYVSLYPETPYLTWTVYDDGVAESVPNITVGTSVVSSTEIKIQVAPGSAFGNPDLQNPVGVCFGVSDLSKFNEVRPANYVSTFPVPKVLKSANITGCYVLPTEALVDDGKHPTFYRFYIVIDPAQNPGVDDYIYVYAFDKTYYLNDELQWVEGFSDDSVRGTDHDPGFQGYLTSNAVKINLA